MEMYSWNALYIIITYIGLRIADENNDKKNFLSKSRLFRTATLLFIVFFLTCCYSRGWLIAGIEPNACGQSENDFSK